VETVGDHQAEVDQLNAECYRYCYNYCYHCHQHLLLLTLQVFAGRMPYLLPNQQCQSTEGVT